MIRLSPNVNVSSLALDNVEMIGELFHSLAISPGDRFTLREGGKTGRSKTHPPFGCSLIGLLCCRFSSNWFGNADYVIGSFGLSSPHA